MTGSDTPRAEVSGGRGVQVGSGNEQVNQYIQTYIENQHLPAGHVHGPGRSGDTLPLRNRTFTGRTQVLEAVGERLAAGPVAVVALRGLGGMGKSQLALEYAYRKRQSGRYQLVGWVRADSRVTVTEDLAALAPLLGLPVEGQAGEIAPRVVGVLRGAVRLAGGVRQRQQAG